MSFYLRYTSTELWKPGDLIAAWTKGVNSKGENFRFLDNGEDENGTYALVYHGEDICLDLSISNDGEIHQSEIDYLKRLVSERIEDNNQEIDRKYIVSVLEKTQTLSTIQPICWQTGRDTEDCLSRLVQLCSWLFPHLPGLLHTEGVGFFYAVEKLLLATNEQY